MSMAVHRRESNITRTVQVRIGDTVTTATGIVVPVLHGFAFGDPDAARDDNGTPLMRWVGTTWPSVGAGSNGMSILQAEIYSRIKGEGDAGGDPFGHVAAEIGDALITKFSGLDGDYPRWWLDVLDFTIPAAPTSTRERMLCQDLGGRDGSPMDRSTGYVEDGFQRRTIRWRFVLIQDAAGPAAFYTA